MSNISKQRDPYIGIRPIQDVQITEKVGKGRVGSMYKAVRDSNPNDVYACKVIPEGKLNSGWQRELQKIALLKGVPNIVEYHLYGQSQDNNYRPFTFILFNFIKGINLRQYISEQPWPLDIAFIENIARTILGVLHACRAVGVQHGDLHEGNIMISDPDSRLLGSPRTIYVCDFGYGGSHNNKKPKDDFKQFFSITFNLIRKMNQANLNARDRVMLELMEEFLNKKVLESDPTQGHYVGNPKVLLEDFNTLRSSAERKSAEIESIAAKGGRGRDIKEPGDYLVAEALGYRVDEWKDLFVPEFLAAQDLLSRNITILTGARGCGKTMAFRRLTAYMDKVIGEGSGVKGADQFIGFYLNCRNLVEAFPWLPTKLSEGMQQQLIHYFHLAWFSEICKTLAIYSPDNEASFIWIDDLLKEIFKGDYHSLPIGADILAHARAFLEDEKENCRLTNLGSKQGLSDWPLARTEFLDILQAKLEAFVPWIGEKPIYMFLDDYTIPIVAREVQTALNPIVFKRRSKLFFKISTEAANSFEREGLRGKPLELHQDFELIDLATESLHQQDRDKMELLDKIFRPRIDRHASFTNKNLSLADVLGKMPVSNNELAKQMRTAASGGGKKRILYYGVEAFVGMWASDIRIMIQMFADMLRESQSDLRKGNLIIQENAQDKIYRAAGGEFLVFTESVNNPAYWEKRSTNPILDKPFGKHLRDITETFINISRFELTKGRLVSNEDRLNPKQAFRLEIVDKFELSDDVIDYYRGLVRWHIFLQDWRGKSVRGMITPRLYLNRVLIPFSYLTFSSHDHIQLTNDEFISLLRMPKKFLKYWQDKKIKRKKGNNIDEGPNLFSGVAES